MFLSQFISLHISFKSHVSEKERKKLSIKLTPQDICYLRFLERGKQQNNSLSLIKALERRSLPRIVTNICATLGYSSRWFANTALPLTRKQNELISFASTWMNLQLTFFKKMFRSFIERPVTPDKKVEVCSVSGRARVTL